MRKVLCFFAIHDWAPWGMPRTVMMQTIEYGVTVSVPRLGKIQERECYACHILQSRNASMIEA